MIPSIRRYQWPQLLNLLAIGIVLSIPPRTLAEEPPEKEGDRASVSGSLVICGGGSLPDSISRKFIQLAGGEKAKLVIVPTASERADNSPDEEFTKRWADQGVASVQVLHTRDRAESNDPQFLVPLKEATGLWFGGGLQSRLAAAYQGTAFETELDNLLKRGGVVGGTSAGAAIQCRVMIASGRSVPRIRTGLDLLPGAIIDQHFTERNRQPRLRLAVKQHPQCLGLGIDEGTAVIVRGQVAQVIGQNKVHVYDANRRSADDEVPSVSLAAGASYQLVKRQILNAAIAEKPAR